MEVQIRMVVRFLMTPLQVPHHYPLFLLIFKIVLNFAISKWVGTVM